MISTRNNLSAMVGIGALGRHNRDLAVSMERLATGRRINRASDDPAGLIAASAIDVEMRMISEKIERLIFDDKRAGAIEGAGSVVSDLLIDLEGLVVQSSNRSAMSPKELEAIQDEADSILKTIDYLAAATTFNGDLVISHLSSRSLGLAGLARGGEHNLIDGDSEKAQEAASSASERMVNGRAGLGMWSKQIETEIADLRIRFESLSQAHSQIVETDYAAEVASLVRARMLREAAQFVTALALKQNTETVLALLR